jgi:hypothetical protein
VATPDPERAFVAHLRAQLTGVTVGTQLKAARPFVRVNLVPGGFEQLRHNIDRVRLDLACYGSDPRAISAQVRDAIAAGFLTDDTRVFSVDTAPAYPIPDAITYEIAYFVSVTASVSAL